MKTIENQVELNCKYYNDYEKSAYELAFKAGVAFAQQWISVEDELPISFERGEWDGLRSDYVIAICKSGNWYKARTYSGFMDGSNFCIWCQEDDSVISQVTHWRPIERL